MSKRQNAAKKRRECESAEVRRAIAHLQQSPPEVDAALAALSGAAIGLDAADALDGKGEGEGEGEGEGAE